MTPTPPEAIEAALALVRILATCDPIAGNPLDELLVEKARRIAAMLPAPVDPAVLACREIIAAYYERRRLPELALQARDGAQDNEAGTQLILAAYRAGQASPMEAERG